jgi:hypothetical protein
MDQNWLKVGFILEEDEPKKLQRWHLSILLMIRYIDAELF